jgi:hypothetical protein
MGAESQCGRRELAEHTPIVAKYHQLVLVVGAGCQPGQAAPLGFDALGVAIGHTLPAIV